MASADPAVAAPAASARLLAALVIASALSPLNSTMIAVALPSIGLELETDPASLTQWLVATYLLAAIVAQSPAGKLGDLFGHGRMLYAGQLGVALGAAVGLLARSVGALAVARVLMAIGGAIIVPSALALVRGRLPVDRRSHVFGAFAAAMALAAAVGPALGGEVVARFGWRGIFVASAPFLAAAAFLAAGCTRDDHRAARPTFDVAGSLLLGAGLALVVVGLERQGAGGAVLGGWGVAALAAFVWWEQRAPEPVVALSLFRRRAYLAGSLVISLQNLALYGLLFQLPFFLAAAAGAGSARVGRSLLALMATVVLLSAASGAITRQLGPRATVAIGALLATIGMCLLALLPVATATAAIPPLLLLGCGIGLSASPSQTAAMNAVGAHQGGMAAGLITTLRYLGGVVGLAILGLVMRVDGGASVSRHRLAMAIFTWSLAFSAVASLGLPRRSGSIVDAGEEALSQRTD